MFGFLFAPSNSPFAIAIIVMLAIAVLEGVGALLGHGLSDLLETLLPGQGVDVDADVDADVNVQTGIDGEPLGAERALSQLLGWLHIGKVPVLVLLVIFLTAFGLSGYVVQAAIANIFHHYAPASIASLPAGFAAIGCVRMLGSTIGRLIPQDETSAVSTETFGGRIATIIRGEAARGRPAEAKLTDEHGTAHYILVEPVDDQATYTSADDLLVVGRNGAVYSVILNTSVAMVDK